MRALALAVLLMLGTAAAEAHHGWRSYDLMRLLVVEGEVVAVQYGSPHVSVDVLDGIKLWHVVLAPPARMERRGLLPDDLVIGMTLRATGYRSKTLIAELRATRIWIDDRFVLAR